MDKEYVILIETATDVCSVALAKCAATGNGGNGNGDGDGAGVTVLAEKTSYVPRAHDMLLATLASDLLKDNGLSVGDCTAVAVSSGPGSYMGLRIGASLAKGIAYGVGLKLLSVNTLEVIAQCALDNGLPQKTVGADCDQKSLFIAPMIDAGRMEVYTALYRVLENADLEPFTPTEAKILTADSYERELKTNTILFTGNGCMKYRDFLRQELGGALPENALFAPQLPEATGLRRAAYRALQKAEYEDVAYFQPFYLKEFIPGKSKKLL